MREFIFHKAVDFISTTLNLQLVNMENIVACSKISLETICRENTGKYLEMSIWMKSIFTRLVDHQSATFLRTGINVEISCEPATENWEPLLGKNICPVSEPKLIKKINCPQSLSHFCYVTFVNLRFTVLNCFILVIFVALIICFY